MRWSNVILPGVAIGIFNAVEANPANPKFSEVRAYRRVRFKSTRLTPRLAYLTTATGNVVMGVPPDGWSEAAVAAVAPAVTFSDTRPT